MRDRQITLRCYAENKARGLWVAVCIDLNLAVQGESYREVRKKLDKQIDDYLQDALVGEDSKYVTQLIPRRAPRKFFLKYYLIHLHFFVWHRVRDFLKVVPIQPRAA
jgi:hypothetical protein